MTTKPNRWLLCCAMSLMLASALPIHAFYNPSTGRWLSRDPIGEHGGMNQYCIVGNAPVNRFDRLGLVSLVSIGTPGNTPDGSYAFAGVWFTFSPSDFTALGGNGAGTLVWSREVHYSISPCGPWATGYGGASTVWFRKSFQIGAQGNLTGGNLWNRGQGLGLEVSGQSADAFLQSHPGALQRRKACGGSHGEVSSDVKWAIMSGTLNGGDTTGLFLAGYDQFTPHSPTALPGWDDWAGAIAQGTLSVRYNWNDCVLPSTKAMSASSNWMVDDGGPDFAGKRGSGQQGGDKHPWEYAPVRF